jgi:hypothetical protein
MLHLKTANTAPALVAAKELQTTKTATENAARAAFAKAHSVVAEHDAAAIAADRAAADHANSLADLVGRKASDSERAIVRADQADKAALAAYHRKQAAAKREQLPGLELDMRRAENAANNGREVLEAEFNDALAAYLEVLPMLEPIVTRLRIAAKDVGRTVADDAHQFSALPKIQGGQLFGQRLENWHFTAPVEVAQ